MSDISVWEQIQPYATKWYTILFGVLVVYSVTSWLQTRFLMRKLGAKPLTNVQNDGFYGFKIPFEMLQAKEEGTMLDVMVDRFNTVEHPSVGTFSIKMFGMTLITTKDPENVKAILATQFNDFALGMRHPQFKPLLGDGIFTLDGEGWKHSRAMLRPQFAREQVSHVKALEPHVQFLAKQIKVKNGKPFDIQELFFRLTVDSATEFLFGETVGSLQDASIGMEQNSLDFDGKKGFAEAFNESQSYLASRAVMQQLYFLLNPKKFKTANNAVHKFADYYVQKALSASPEELEKHSRDGYIFLYELVKETRNPTILRDQLLNILVAGRDTTAGLLSFTFYELSRNPSAWNKLKEEIYEKFGKGDDSRIDEITFESLKKCEYLKALLNESLRLYPSVPQNFRLATRDTTLPRGGGPDGNSPILVRKGQTVSYSVYVTHRDEATYGKDALEFRPERWFEPETRKLGWSFLPFNGGPRICLGQQFALTEASYVVARLVQIFSNLESFNPEEYPPKKNSQLTVCLKSGCQISLS